MFTEAPVLCRPEFRRAANGRGLCHWAPDAALVACKLASISPIQSKLPCCLAHPASKACLDESNSRCQLRHQLPGSWRVECHRQPVFN